MTAKLWGFGIWLIWDWTWKLVLQDEQFNRNLSQIWHIRCTFYHKCVPSSNWFNCKLSIHSRPIEWMNEWMKIESPLRAFSYIIFYLMLFPKLVCCAFGFVWCFIISRSFLVHCNLTQGSQTSTTFSAWGMNIFISPERDTCFNHFLLLFDYHSKWSNVLLYIMIQLLDRVAPGEVYNFAIKMFNIN